jgi:hypothetical protein
MKIKQFLIRNWEIITVFSILAVLISTGLILSIGWRYFGWHFL